MPYDILIIGLGKMGKAIASRLLDRGLRVCAWNRTSTAGEDFQHPSFQFIEDLSAAVKESRVWLTLLGDSSATWNIWKKLLPLADSTSNPVWLQTATLEYASTVSLAGESVRHGIRFIDCPVLGGVGEARKGELIVLAGGNEDDLKSTRPLMELYSTHIEYCGPIGAGTLMKLTFNLLLAHQMTGFAEWMNFGRQCGLCAESLWGVLRRSKLMAPMMPAKWEKLLKEDYQPTFRLRWMRKDLHAILEAAHSFGIYVPLTYPMKALYDAASAHGLDDDDYSSIYRIFQMLSRGFKE